MTDFHPLDVLAYALITLVPVALVGHYVYTKLLDLIRAQTALIAELVAQTKQGNAILVSANRPALRADAARRDQELTEVLLAAGLFETPSDRASLIAFLPDPVRTRIAERTPGTVTTRQALTTIVTEAARYDVLKPLCWQAVLQVNGAQGGGALRAWCAQWGIPVPPKEGESL